MGSEPEDLASVEKHLQAERDLAESLIEAAQAMVLQLDADGRIVRINPFMEKISGYAQEEVAGRELISTFLPERDRVRARTRLSGIIDGTVKSGSVYPIVLKDGTERIIKWHSRTLEDSSGHGTGLVSVGIDVTDEVLSREDVRRTEDSYRTLLELLPDAVVLIDLEGRITTANEQALRLYGIEDSDKIVGMTFMQLIAPEDHERAAANFSRRLGGESLEDVQYTITTADGRARQALIRATLVTDEEDSPTSVIAGIRDITDRIEAEEALKRSEAMYRTIVEMSPDSIAVSDLEGRLVAVNEQTVRQHGFDSADELIGRIGMELIAPEDRQGAAENLRSLIGGSDRGSIPYSVLRKDGTTFIVDTRASLMQDLDGNAMIVSCSRDVTDRAQAELMAELNAQRLRALTSQLTLLEERKRRAIAAELHDSVGQTLAVASMKLGQIGRGAPPDLQRQLAEVKELWEQAMKYTRALVAELSPPVLHELGLEAALEWLVERQRRFSEFDISFEDDGLPKPIEENVAILLFQCARELLVNAAKHAEARSVGVSIWRASGGIAITVQDDGVGFDPGEAEAGDGFGIFAVRERVELIGGSMKLDTSPGRGCKVTLQAPLDSAGAERGKS